MSDITDTEAATEAEDVHAVDTSTEADVQQTDTSSNEDTEAGADTDAETFPRSYVEKLRRQNASYRERANTADTYAERLHTELVKATGRLADPTDVPFDETHLVDPDALAAAVDDLLARKPHLASRRPTGDIGQGPVSGNGSSVDLAAILRQQAL